MGFDQLSSGYPEGVSCVPVEQDSAPSPTNSRMRQRTLRFRYQGQEKVRKENYLGYFNGRTDEIAVTVRKVIYTLRHILLEIESGHFQHPWEQERARVRDKASQLLQQIHRLTPEKVNSQFVTLIHGINQASNHTTASQDYSIGKMIELQRELAILD